VLPVPDDGAVMAWLPGEISLPQRCNSDDEEAAKSEIFFVVKNDQIISTKTLRPVPGISLFSLAKM
jgi:hypothetical protein